ncbi:Gfo/Idh/MocA family protein [Paludibaculum fermentans]|uniref:Gfo/Idh/MocA family protein n=1 Tax=Paludibaculum fermentans TaxID=1473598 RepID=UPI003EBC0765
MRRISRRTALAGAAGTRLMGAETMQAPENRGSIRLGIIGAGARGQYVGGHMARDGRARVTAVCDLFDDRIEQAKKIVPGAGAAKVYKDYRQVLDDKEVDAVLIATPVYLHPEMFEAAVAAGKHVYCEKPAGMDVAGVQRLMQAGRKADPRKVIQFGFQQRFSPEYLKARELVAAGRLGELKILMSFWILGMSPRLAPPAAQPYPELPEEMRRVRLWTRWRELSGGDIVECDCHGLDTLNWFAGGHPVSALGKGGLRYPIFYGNITSDHYDIIFSYPNGAEGYLISARAACGFRDVREQFYGSKGVLETARTYYRLHGPVAAARLANDDQLEDTSMIEKFSSRREITIDAVEAFFTAIAEGQQRNMSQDAGLSTLTSILGRMAFELKREVTWEEMLRTG